MQPHLSPPSDTLDEDVMRELRYCAFSPGNRFTAGQIGRAQDEAISRGWLTIDNTRPADLRVVVTPRGRGIIKRSDHR